MVGSVPDRVVEQVDDQLAQPGTASLAMNMLDEGTRSRNSLQISDDLAVTLSSGRTGQCWDNALAESFFAALKGECLDQQPWPSSCTPSWSPTR